MRRSMEGAEEFAHEHGARRAYYDVEKLLQDSEVDAVYIATPVDQHCPHTLAAANQRKHLLCEKPLALNVSEAEVMLEACRRTGITAMTCYYQRFNARHQKIKEILQRGDIGPVSAVRWNFSGRSPANPTPGRRTPLSPEEDPIWIWGVMGWTCFASSSAQIVAVTAFVDTLVEDYAVEDTASSLLRFANGIQAVATAHWSTGDPDENRNSMIEILGTKGVVRSYPLHDKFSRGHLSVATGGGEKSYHFEDSTHVKVLKEFATALAEGSGADSEGDWR